MKYAFVVVLAGCSFFVPVSRPRVYGEKTECSAPRTAAIVDTTATTAFAGAAAVLWYEKFSNPAPPCNGGFGECYDPGFKYAVWGALSTVTSLIYGISAATGWGKVNACSGGVPPEDRPGYAEWLNHRFAERKPPVRFSVRGPEARTLLVTSPACGTAELVGWLQGDFLKATVEQGFTDVRCVPDYMP